MDASDSVVGLITLEDVVAELLGGVSDEFKSMQARPIRLSDGRLRLPGSTRLDQIAPLIGPAWRNVDRTIAEQITAVLGRVPEPGEKLEIDGVRVEVEAVEGDVIASVIVGDPPRQVEGTDA